MLSKLGIPAPPAIDYLIAFVVIFVLLALAALVLRRLTGGRLALPGQDRGRTRQPRLGVVDVYDLDRQRQLILLRRDNVEHLLLIGGPNDVVIETNIVRVAGARLPAPAGEPTLERIEPAPERTGEATAAQPTLEPPRPATPVAARLGAVPNGGAETRPARGARPPAPSARVEPALKPDTVALAPEPGAAGPELEGAKEPEPAAPPARPTPAPGPAPARRAPQPPPAARLRPVEAEPRPAPPRPESRPAVPAPAPQPAQSEPAAADAAVLTDMARQLEEALRQPRPAPKAPEAAAPAQDEPFVPPAPAPGPPPQASAPPSAPLPSLQPAQPRPAERPAPASPAPARPLRAEPAAEPSAAPSQAAPPAPAPPASRGDPFSVEEIEAEFARLLGRPLDKNEKG